MLRRLREHSIAHLGASPHPELTLSWPLLGSATTAWQAGDLDTTQAQLVLSSVRLRQAGANFLVCTDDTAYAPLSATGVELALPALHAAALVAEEAQGRGFSRVGVLGTRWTLSSGTYADHFTPKGIAVESLSAWDETTLQSVVFDELIHDKYSHHARDAVLSMVERFRRQGCHAVVVGCPELTSLVSPATSPLPLLDPTAILAGAAIRVATGDGPFPEWRGGQSVPEVALVLTGHRP